MHQCEREQVKPLFVYGTLMRRSLSPVARRLAQESMTIGAGTIAGTLYSLGYYPGLTEAVREDDRVYGELVRLLHPRRSFIWMDAYEGCAPDTAPPALYERRIIPVYLDTGQTIHGWAYFYKGKLPSARRIPNGRFFAKSRASK